MVCSLLEYPCAERVGIGRKLVGIPIRRGVGWGSSKAGEVIKNIQAGIQIYLMLLLI